MLIVCLAAPGAAGVGPIGARLAVRIVLLVDSSAAVAPMLTQFRAGLNEFLDVLPGDPEMHAHQHRRSDPDPRAADDRPRRSFARAASLFASDGGANSFLDTLLEADKRFLRTVADPAVGLRDPDDRCTARVAENARIDEYNRFVNDFHQRGGRAHGIVIRGVNSGITTDILSNLTDNTGGFYDSLIIANPLPERMKALVDLVAADHEQAAEKRSLK